MPFTTLGLSPALVRAATDARYFMPTPVQSAAIPAVLRGQDVLGLAQTGPGKTTAFSLPLLQRWAAPPRHRSRRAVHTLVGEWPKAGGHFRQKVGALRPPSDGEEGCESRSRHALKGSGASPRKSSR
ncbi:DEAD/DEAH box helicase [Variovorax guangxiensis]|uniref:DEAD/DEAH box helicase n=1 Tax=Variovorax guangxiensis TaxID=1775474 RepID=UPI0038F64F23